MRKRVFSSHSTVSTSALFFSTRSSRPSSLHSTTLVGLIAVDQVTSVQIVDSRQASCHAYCRILANSATRLFAASRRALSIRFGLLRVVGRGVGMTRLAHAAGLVVAGVVGAEIR